MVNRLLYAVALLGVPVIGITLWAWGQPLISRSGEVHLWVNSVWSGENSQQIADWYSLSHVIHGLLIALIGRGLARWVPFPAILAVAIVTGVGWEIVEHTEWVLGQFRDTTIYQGYVGDSVLNAVWDYLFMMGGFLLGLSLPVGWAVAIVCGLEIGSALIARDSLLLTTLRVLHPIPAIERWQDELNPRSQTAPAVAP